MSRLLDPTICPDCRAPLDAESHCTACGLHLTGPLAAQLWSVISEADRLVTALRRAAVPTQVQVPAPAGTVAALRNAAPLPPMPAPRHPDSAPARRRLPALTVPVVLLGLGALCLLVAALVFVAIAWGMLGITGRTVVLVGVTSLVATVAAVATSRGLRGAAESLWVVVAGLVALDLAGARSAGLLGLDRLDAHQLGLLLGGSQLALGTGVALWARRTTVAELVAPQVCAALGALLAGISGAWLAEDPRIGCALAVATFGGLAMLLAPRLWVVGCSLGGFAVLSWLELAGLGLARTVEDLPPGLWWSHLRAWPLLLVAVYAALPALSPQLAAPLRSAAAGTCLAVLNLVALAPLTQLRRPDGVLRTSLVEAAVLIGLALLARWSPTVWARAAAALTAVGTAWLGLAVAREPWQLLLGPDSGALPRPWWTWLATTGAVAVGGLGVLHRFPAAPVKRVWVVCAVALGLVATTSATGTPIRTTAATATVAALLTLAATWALGRRDGLAADLMGAGVTGFLALTALALAAGSWRSLAVAATVLAAALLLALTDAQRRGEEARAAVSGAVVVPLGALALLGWLVAAGVDARGVAVALAAYASLTLLVAAPVARRTSLRVALEGASALPAVLAVVYGGDVRPDAATALAAGVALWAALHRDRAVGAVVPVALLALATAARVDHAAHLPEAWVLPVAVLLAGGGMLRRHDLHHSELLLGSGLGLGYVVLAARLVAPSDLPWAAATETTVLAVAVAGLLVAVDGGARWTAPMAAALAALLGGSALVDWGTTLDLSASTTTLVLATYAGVVALLAAPATRSPAPRVAMEAASFLVALASMVRAGGDLTEQAMVLTVLGTTLAVLAALRRDRAHADWLATAVLAIATVLRVVAAVPFPERFTLPAAMLMVVAGLWRLRQDPTVSSAVLTSGLSLALVPSLLLALQDPTSLRALLLGAGAAAVLLLGARGRLAAPFLMGAITLCLLTVREIEPYGHAVPRWGLLGGLGVALLAVGVTWEARLADARAARRYLARLR